jgi:hypothetical protein
LEQVEQQGQGGTAPFRGNPGGNSNVTGTGLSLTAAVGGGGGSIYEASDPAGNGGCGGGGRRSLLLEQVRKAEMVVAQTLVLVVVAVVWVDQVPMETAQQQVWLEQALVL